MNVLLAYITVTIIAFVLLTIVNRLLKLNGFETAGLIAIIYSSITWPITLYFAICEIAENMSNS